MKTTNNTIIIFIFLLFLSILFYYYQEDTVPIVSDDITLSHDRVIFEKGYTYLASGKFDEATEYYNSIKNEIEDQFYLEKHDRLMVILNRLNSASELYVNERELLDLAATFRSDYLDKWYEPLLEVYDFYHLSHEVILENNYDKEEHLITLYLKNANSFEDMFDNINNVESQFFTKDDKENFSKSIEYSIFPASAYYKITYISESISLEEIEKVENAWNHWDIYYNKVMDYYQYFDEGLYLLDQEVKSLKDGYNELKKQLTLLIPDLKFDNLL